MTELSGTGDDQQDERSVAEAERLFIAEQPTIKAAIVQTARRYRLNRTEIDDLTSDVALKLIDGDYAVLRKFQGRSSLRTYLTVVVQRVLLDSRVAKWGKWRASALARRSGPAGILFEQLYAQGGLSFDAACAAIERTLGGPIDRDTFRKLAARQSARRRLHAVCLDDVAHVLTAPANPASVLLDEDARVDAERKARLLARAIDALPPVDRHLIRRRFFDNASIASVARETAQDQKLLYRRMSRLLTQLRHRLEGQALTRA